MRDFIYAASGGNLDRLKKMLAEDPNIKNLINQTAEIRRHSYTDHLEIHSALKPWKKSSSNLCQKLLNGEE